MWFGQWSKDYKNYDLKKFKVIRAVTVGIVFILSFLMGFCEFKLYISTSSFTIVRKKGNKQNGQLLFTTRIDNS